MHGDCKTLANILFRRYPSPLFALMHKTLISRSQFLWQLAYISSMRRRRAWAELSLLGLEHLQLGGYVVLYVSPLFQQS
ncbi:hypothetical protein OIU78_017022 [Salix suchowensis]|nr:hypothetical protein OIU78_017022 [Salix suchowensis]